MQRGILMLLFLPTKPVRRQSRVISFFLEHWWSTSVSNKIFNWIRKIILSMEMQNHSTMYDPQMQFQRIDRSTQIALFARCTRNCSDLIEIILGRILSWTITFNPTDQSSFGKCEREKKTTTDWMGDMFISLLLLLLLPALLALDPIARSIYTIDRERARKNRGEIQRHRETQERERSQERSPLPANSLPLPLRMCPHIFGLAPSHLELSSWEIVDANDLCGPLSFFGRLESNPYLAGSSVDG